ncbi:MAG: acyltransferase family protein [Clostridia bacterium]|nr:acyltransferase family protein [Clostridia bacterium]
MKAETLQQTVSTRTVYLDYLRVLATFAVIVVHATSGSFSNSEISPSSSTILILYNNLFSWVVPVFVMISGSLFLSPNRNYTIKDLTQKYIFRLGCAYLFWSFINSFFVAGKEFTILDIAIYTLNGQSVYWYIPMIACLYLLVPLFKNITSNQTHTKYFLILFIIFAILTPQILDLSSTVLSNTLLAPFIQSFQNIFNNTHFHFAIGYSGYFVLGYYLGTCEFNKAKRNLLLVLGLLAFGIAIFISTCDFENTALKQILCHNFTIRVFFESIFVFWAVKLFKNRFTKILLLDKIIIYISKNSFGIYLTHIFVLRLLKDLNFSVLSFTPIFAVPIVSLCSFSICFIISIVARKIPLLGKYIT